MATDLRVRSWIFIVAASWPEPKTASTHESRKTKMCPFHKDVVDISLAQGEPQAGFGCYGSALGRRPSLRRRRLQGRQVQLQAAMTTQSWWDERKEKAEQRKQEREQAAAELEAQQPTEEIVDDAPVEDIVEDSVEAPVEDNVVEVDFGGAEHDCGVAEPRCYEPLAGS
jgi:ATPase subunit of ABC transporter with duplicated ATPase domains